MGDIAVVVLDLNRENDQYDKFAASSAEDQIKSLAHRIEAVAHALQQKEPNSMWIISWREYGITDGWERTLNPEQKELFKNTLKKLVEYYKPNLTIIGGTVATKKKVTKKDKIAVIANAYETHAWIKEKESHWEEQQQHMAKEEEKVQAIQNRQDEDFFYAVRNTCYVYTSEVDNTGDAKVKLWRHDKIAPYKETKQGADPNNLEIFQPGKDKNLSPICELRHPFTNEIIRVGIEICREHDYKNLSRHEGTQEILLQFLLSDSIAPRIDRRIAEFVFPIDSKYKPRLFTKNSDLNDLRVNWYQMDMASDSYELTGPLAPSYPFELYVFDALNNAYNKLPNSHNKKVLFHIINDFYNGIYENKGANVAAVYDALERALDKHSHHLQIEKLSQSSSVFTQLPRLDVLITSLYKLLEEERAKKLPACEFLSKEDAKLNDKVARFINAIDLFDIPTALSCIKYFNVLDHYQLTIAQTYLLINMIYSQPLSMEEKKFYFDEIFANAYTLSNVTDEKLEDKSLLQLFCAMNMSEALESALQACKENSTNVVVDYKSTLEYAKGIHADEEIISMLEEFSREAKSFDLHK